MFPEYWMTWKGEVIYIGDMCKKHDENCGSHGFYRDLWKARLVGAVTIATIASVACWVIYSKIMINKLRIKK